MPEVDVSRLISEIDPFDLSASVAERGANVGRETWNNAKAAAEAAPLDYTDVEGVKEFFAGFGAWDRDEITAWTRADLDALILQFAAGDLREAQSLCPGDGLADIDWDAFEVMASEGTIGGRIFVSDDKLYVMLCE